MEVMLYQAWTLRLYIVPFRERGLSCRQQHDLHPGSVSVLSHNCPSCSKCRRFLDRPIFFLLEGKKWDFQYVTWRSACICKIWKYGRKMPRAMSFSLMYWNEMPPSAYHSILYVAYIGYPGWFNAAIYSTKIITQLFWFVLEFIFYVVWRQGLSYC